MPLFRALDEHAAGFEPRRQRRRTKRTEWMGSGGGTDEGGCVLSLAQLCLLSLADNMKELWAKDYADNYLDHYFFRHIMGPFNILPGELVEELTRLLCARKQLTRAALHLLLVPQLRGLSLEKCPALATFALCGHITARCQALCSLDLSGAQLPSKVLSETLCCLPVLRWLSLASSPCDRRVISTIAHHCPLLRHLDVSRCHSLSPAALLPLGGGALSGISNQTPVSESSSAPGRSNPPLSSLLAHDIGIWEEEGDHVATAAYLLLALPCLKRLAMEGLAEACSIIQRRDFQQTEEFTAREGLPGLEEVWKERGRHQQGMESEEEDEEEEDEVERNRFDDESQEEKSASQNNTKGKKAKPHFNEPLILHLRDVEGLTCDSLDSFASLCPYIHSISLSVSDLWDGRGTSPASRLASGLQTWSGQLHSLSVHHTAALADLLPALQAVGSSLLLLSLEGVKTNTDTPLLEVIRACPKLRELLVSAEPPVTQLEEDDEDEPDEQDITSLPNLVTLTLNFSYEHNHMRPAMSWRSLRKVIRCLLAGSPFLEKLSLVSLPCSLDSVLKGVADLNVVAAPSDSLPLGKLRHVNVPRTDVKMTTVKSVMQRSKRLKYFDVSHCWQISRLEWSNCQRGSDVQVVWI